MNRGDWQKEFDRLAADDGATGTGATAGRKSGDSLSELWTPDAAAQAPPTADLGEVLLQAGTITAAQLTTARSVAAKTPGKSMADIFYDMGIPEAAIQEKVAALANLAFQRLEEPSIVDSKFLNRLSH